MRELPVAVVGGGPVGLAAAVHLVEREVPFVVLEAGPEIGAAVREWGHVRMFSPWRWNIDLAARRYRSMIDWLLAGEPGGVIPLGEELPGAAAPGQSVVGARDTAG